MNTVMRNIGRILEQGETLVLATIISQHGSTPRTAGTKMIVSADGQGIGTIGGGLLEARVMRKAGDVFAAGVSRMISFELSHEDVAAMDMICGGNLEVLLELLEPTPENRQLFGRIKQMTAARNPGLLITGLGQAGALPPKPERCLLGADGDSFGPLKLNPSTVRQVEDLGGNLRYPVVIEAEGGRFLLEPINVPSRLYIFGAGHVSKPTAALAAMVDFEVTVLDDRPEFASRDRFPDASDIRVLGHLGRAMEGLAIDDDSYLVIVTRGHLHDKTVLAGALGTKAAYIGMIGSRKKRDAIYKVLMEEGFSNEDIQRVHSPIGLAIGAETPEEIAVSIVSELIQCRAQRK